MDVHGAIEPASATSRRPDPFVLFPAALMVPGDLTAVKTEECFNYYGPFKAGSLVGTAADFIVANSDTSRDSVARVLIDFLSSAEDNCKAGASSFEKDRITECCWFTIRMSQPDDEWVVPRWHQDGRMFDCTCASPQLPHSKYAVSLLGPPTRVLAPHPSVSKAFQATEHLEYEECRSTLAELLADHSPIRIDAGQMIRFSWGQDDSPVHSEPDSSSTSRVFVSILFGNEEELRNMCDFREETFASSIE